MKKIDSNGNYQANYFIPELCYLIGLEGSELKDYYFRNDFNEYTKLEPNKRVAKTNIFIDLLNDESTDVSHQISPKAKKETFGIEIKPYWNLFEAYYMKEPELILGNRDIINVGQKQFPVYENIDMTNWVCLYENKNYNIAGHLLIWWFKLLKLME